MVQVTFSKNDHLSKDEIKDMKLFVKHNNEETGFMEFFYWDAIEHRLERKTPLDWLCYVDGKLIAYVAIYYFNNSVLEINISLIKAMYEHSYDIFKQLYDELYNTFSRYRLVASVVKINFENKIITSTLSELGANLVATSFYMQRSKDASVYEQTNLNCKLANKESIDILVEIQVACFNDDADEYKKFLERSMHNSKRAAYIFHIGEDPVGKIHVLDCDDYLLIEEVCVLPGMQSEGYEVLMLQELCNIMHNKKSLLIEIDTDIEVLTKLYKELNFYKTAVIHSYDRDLRIVNESLISLN